MAHGLELRPLLLDHPLVEFAYALPRHLKWNENHGKLIFIKAGASYLPAEVVHRPKMGFSIPTADWAGTSPILRDRMAELFGGDVAHVLFGSKLETAFRHHRPGRPIPGFLWSWFILLEWIERNGFLLPF